MEQLKYRSEEEMKDSDVEWLGKIPREWSIDRIQRFFSTRSKKVSDKEYEPLSVTKKGIVKQLENVAKTDNGNNRKKVLKNDFVINSRADRKGSCGVSSFRGSVSLICHVLKPSKKIEPYFANYLFKNYYFAEEFFRWGTGIVDDLWSTNMDRMNKILIPLPIYNEQQKIANFLDIKTSQFDSIISKKEKLIEKLEEAKKSLISQVVTGKVKIVDGEMVERTHEKMKDSGVQWLGMIPKDWEVKALKYGAKVNMGQSPDSAYVNQDAAGLPFYQGKAEFGEVYPSPMNYCRKPRKVAHKNSILLSVRAPVGDINIANEDCGIGRGLAAITKFKNMNYFYYILKFSKIGLSGYSTGSTFEAVSVSQIENLKIPYTNEKEQNKIADYLDDKCNKVDNIITKTKSQIQKLKEAKQSLISEAVTGKIDLREWEIKEQEALE